MADLHKEHVCTQNTGINSRVMSGEHGQTNILKIYLCPVELAWP